MLFRTFSPQFEDIDTFQCSSDSFPHWQHILGCVQNCHNYISMYHCSPIAGGRSWKSFLNLSHCYVPCPILFLFVFFNFYQSSYKVHIYYLSPYKVHIYWVHQVVKDNITSTFCAVPYFFSFFTRVHIRSIFITWVHIRSIFIGHIR